MRSVAHWFLENGEAWLREAHGERAKILREGHSVPYLMVMECGMTLVYLVNFLRQK